MKDLRDGMAPRAKFKKFRKRQHLCPGFVEALMSFIDVEKGDDDIRIVFNGTASGLNDVLSALW
jgi:hypothetical protein